jgi:signal peptidase
VRIIRFLGNVALWVGACLGLVAGTVWIGGQLGWIQPLIVISGSMEPGIDTGDLLIDRWVPTADLEVGDIVSLPSSVTDKVVTHRIVSITPSDDTWQIRMKGDANPEDDIEPYIVGDKVLTPALQVPGGGTVVSKLMDPNVALPILLALIALLGLSLLDEPQRQRVRDDELLHPDQTDAQSVDQDLVDEKPTIRPTALDELDIALAALGVDIAHLDEQAGGDWSDQLKVVWPGDDHLDVVLPERSHDDERELVLTG